MAIYAIGDLQGCYDSLQRLLEKLDFSPENDQIWFVGDLVNRGKKSLKTLRFVKSLGDSAITVLGNHDVSLIAMHYCVLPPSRSLKKLLGSPYREELVDWLRHQPVFHVDEELGFCMAHAGVSPQWGLAEAQQHAHEIEAELRGNDVAEWISYVYGNKPRIWSDDLTSYKRHRYILNAFTRMRYCNAKSMSLNFKLNKPPQIKTKKIKSAKHVPWFLIKNRKSLPLQVVFGHWSSLGYYQDDNVIALDTGCVWGGQITAARLDTSPLTLVSEPCRQKK
ncbi:MAG: symmetrical bis(5'-nucleosyl)-tetraphosphatase [Cocleimonas sp.]